VNSYLNIPHHWKPKGLGQIVALSEETTSRSTNGSWAGFMAKLILPEGTKV
jgi:hypothetical protein